VNRIRIVLVVPEMSDEDALKLKKALEKLLEPKPGATVTMTLRPVATSGWR